MRKFGQQPERRGEGLPRLRRSHTASIRFATRSASSISDIFGDLGAVGNVYRGEFIDDLSNGAAAVAAAQNLARRSLGLDYPFGTQQNPGIARRVEMETHARAIAAGDPGRLRHQNSLAQRRQEGSALA